MTDNNGTPINQLEWIKLRTDLDEAAPETVRDRLIRRTKDNPFVPLGCLATAAVLSVGVYSMKTGNSYLSQRMMRARIIAQGLTIAVLIGGVLYGARQ